MVGSHVGPYLLTRLLGEGGMGAVYEAINESIERRVAIKVLHPDAAARPDIVARFFNEARAVNRVAHPSIVQIYEHGSLPDGTAYIVMEYLNGQTLAHRLQQIGRRLPPKIAVQIAWQVAAALAAAHEKEIVHRDLNPSNLMLVKDPLGPGGERVKVLDFGIAKLVEDARKGRTSSELIMGTPTYMSPEQCHGADVVDDKTDVYALGVILFEMLTGRPPFVAEAAGDLVGMQLFRAPPLVSDLAPDVPIEIVAFTDRLLTKDRTQRPTMHEAAEQLTDLASLFAAPGSTGAIPVLLPSSTSQRSGPNRMPQPPSAGSPVLMPSNSMSMSGPVLVPAPPVAPRMRSLPRLLGSALLGSALMAGLLFLMRPMLLTAISRTKGAMVAANGAPASADGGVGSEQKAAAAAIVARTAATDRAKMRARGPLPPLRDATLHAPPIWHPAATVQPAVNAQPKPPPMNAAEIDRVLSMAQSEYLQRNYQKALDLAKGVVQQSPPRAWRIIGSAGCGLSDVKLVKDAYARLDDAGRQYLYFVCQRSGIDTKSFGSAGKP